VEKLTAIILLSAMFVAPAWAATKTATLAVPGMTCAACPITVKAALSRVVGVEGSRVNIDKREAIVTYDDTRTHVDALTKATKDAGYPSTVVR
jgi:mercuric ion binding protein